MFPSAIASIWLLAATAAAAPAPKPAPAPAPAKNEQGPLSSTDCSYGEVYVFTTAECTFRINNLSARAITATIKPVVPDDTANPSSITVPAHGSTEVKATVAIGNAPGDGAHMFKVHVDEKSSRDVFAKAEGFGLSALEDARPRADFKSVDLSSKAADPITLTLESHEAPAFRIERVISAPKGIDASISSDKQSVTLSVSPDAPWSALEDYVKVAIDTPHQKEAWISVKAEIHGDISAASNPVWFGIVPPDADRKVLIPLRSKKGADFRIGDIALHDVEGTTRTLPCEPVEAGCKMVELDISKQQHPGWLRGVVAIDLPDSSKSIAVSVWGVLQYPKSDAAHAAEQAAPAAVAPATAPAAANIGAAMSARASADTAPVAPPPGRGPLLKWSVVNDNGVHGYQVFRANAEAGPFVLLNPKTIPSKATDAQTVESYQWRDETAETGKTYWYYVGAVNKDGSKRKLSNPHKKTVTE